MRFLRPLWQRRSRWSRSSGFGSSCCPRRYGSDFGAPGDFVAQIFDFAFDQILSSSWSSEEPEVSDLYPVGETCMNRSATEGPVAADENTAHAAYARRPVEAGPPIFD